MLATSMSSGLIAKNLQVVFFYCCFFLTEMTSVFFQEKKKSSFIKSQKHLTQEKC